MHLIRASLRRLLHSSLMRWFMTFLVLANQHGKNSGQQHEHQRLNKADQQLHKVKWNRQQPTHARYQLRHCLEHVLPRKNVAIEPKAKRDRAKQNREDFQAADGKKDDDHEQFERSGGIAFGREQMQKETNRANFLYGPDNPAGKENQRHSEGHVEVGIRPAKERLFHLKTVRAVMAPSDVAKKRNQPGPIGNIGW